MKEIFGESLPWLFKPFQSNQPLDVFKLTHGVLWVLISNFVNGACLFHKIFKIGLEQSVSVK
jgi:hypothetical protein